MILPKLQYIAHFRSPLSVGNLDGGIDCNFDGTQKTLNLVFPVIEIGCLLELRVAAVPEKLLKRSFHRVEVTHVVANIIHGLM